jgi:hypothetical protein
MFNSHSKKKVNFFFNSLLSISFSCLSLWASCGKGQKGEGSDCPQVDHKEIQKDKYKERDACGGYVFNIKIADFL